MVDRYGRAAPPDPDPVTYPRPPEFDRTPDDFVTVADIQAAEQRLKRALLDGHDRYQAARDAMSAAVAQWSWTGREGRAEKVERVERALARTDAMRAAADQAVADAEAELAELKAAWLAGGAA